VNLYRDNTVKDEYWVYYNKYKLARENDLGKFQSSAFDDF